MEVGEVGSDVSRSARRQACEQYASPEVCRSQARQKSGDQSISIISWSNERVDKYSTATVRYGTVCQVELVKVKIDVVLK